MAEYIDREVAKKMLDEYRISRTMSMYGDKDLLTEWRDGVKRAMNKLDELPTADVVPKSEVDKLKIAYEGSQKTIKGLTETIREKNKELAKLETHLELHYGQRSLNNLIAEEKAEVAIEILREIDNALSKFYCYEYGMVRRYIPPLLIELKNKYAEGNYDRT